MLRLLLTGAAGILGTVLREKLKQENIILRLSDIADLGTADTNEECVQCDLTDMTQVLSLVEGCDIILHFGGLSTENSFNALLSANIQGTYNIYEAARQKGVSRILFASSNHLTGFHPRETRLDANVAMRPDSLYAVTKGFGELLARYYYDKFDIESACVRIGSSFPKPYNRRLLATWLSFEDLTSLVNRVIATDLLGYAIIYGVSNNREQWWNNHLVGYLGWEPKDSSIQFEQDPCLKTEHVDRHDPAIRFQGGGFTSAGHFEDDLKA